MASAGSQNGGIEAVPGVKESTAQRWRLWNLLPIHVFIVKPLQQGLRTRQCRQREGVVVLVIDLMNIGAFARQPLTPRQTPLPGHQGKGVVAVVVDLVDVNAELLKRLQQLKKTRLSGQSEGIITAEVDVVDIDTNGTQPQSQRLTAGGGEHQDVAAGIVNQPGIGTVLHQQFDGFTVAAACSYQ